MSTRLRIEDVAAASNVSKATVSQVLRNTGRISAETRAKVMQAAEQLGYVYNRAAANLRAGRSTIVGIGVPSLTNPFFADLVSGASQVLEADGYYPMLSTIDDDLGRQSQFGKTLRENASAGAILCLAPGSTHEQLQDWKIAREPCVCVLRPPPSGLFDFVGVDNEAGMLLATQHMVEAGHRAIGYLGGLDTSFSRKQRLAGWTKGLTEAGIEPDPNWVEGCAATITAASLAVERLLTRAPELTALICHQDIVAFGATIGLRKLKREPGADFSVMGFDDITMASDWDPPLTTVSVTPRQLGAEAARLLTRRINEPTAPLRSVYIQPELIVRRSTTAKSPRYRPSDRKRAFPRRPGARWPSVAKLETPIRTAAHMIHVYADAERLGVAPAAAAGVAVKAFAALERDAGAARGYVRTVDRRAGRHLELTSSAFRQSSMVRPGSRPKGARA